jgi:hypothetical protein
MAFVLGNLPGAAIFLIGVAGHQAIGLLHGGWIHRGSRGADRRKQQKYRSYAAQHCRLPLERQPINFDSRSMFR